MAVTVITSQINILHLPNKYPSEEKQIRWLSVDRHIKNNEFMCARGTEAQLLHFSDSDNHNLLRMCAYDILFIFV